MDSSSITSNGRQRGNPLLLAGAMCGPVLYGLVAAQIILRPGFDFMRHPLSLLTLGSAGWVQRAAFAVAGLLVFAGVVGLRQRRPDGGAHKWVAALLAIFGLGTLLAGVFVPDPAFGFPPGTPDRAPTTMSAHSMIHGMCFDVAFLAAIVAMFVLGTAYFRRGDRRWAWFSFLVGLILPVLIVAGMKAQSSMGASFFVAGALGFGWVSATFLHARSSKAIRAGAPLGRS